MMIWAGAAPAQHQGPPASRKAGGEGNRPQSRFTAGRHQGQRDRLSCGVGGGDGFCVRLWPFSQLALSLRWVWL